MPYAKFRTDLLKIMAVHKEQITSLNTHSTLTQGFLTFKTLFNRSFLGRLLIFILLLRLNSCSSDLKTNSPKCTTLYLTPPTLLKTSASSLTNILLSLTKLYLPQKPVTITFVNFAVSGFTAIRQLIADCTIAYTSIVHSKLDYCRDDYCTLRSEKMKKHVLTPLR